MDALSYLGHWLRHARSCPPMFPPNSFETLPLGNGETIRCKITQVIWGHEIAADGTLSDEVIYYFAITPEGKYFRLTAAQLNSMVSDENRLQAA